MRRLLAAIGTVAILGLLITSARAVTASSPADRAARHAAPAVSGIDHLSGIVDLQSTPSGTWVNTNLEVKLPEPGTYALDVNARLALTGEPPVDAWAVARLRDRTAGSVVSNSTRILNQINEVNGSEVGQNTTAPISERITVDEPTVIELQVMRTGRTTAANVRSDSNGATSFRFQKISA
jgi:hypothetical protein